MVDLPDGILTVSKYLPPSSAKSIGWRVTGGAGALEPVSHRPSFGRGGRVRLQLVRYTSPEYLREWLDDLQQ